MPDLARNYATKYTAEEMNTLNRVENSSAFMGGLSQVHADTGPRPNMNSITPGKILKGDPSASGFLPVRPTTTAPQSQPLGDKPLGPTTTVNSTIPGPKMPGAPANLPGSNALEASVDKKLPKKP